MNIWVISRFLHDFIYILLFIIFYTLFIIKLFLFFIREEWRDVEHAVLDITFYHDKNINLRVL